MRYFLPLLVFVFYFQIAPAQQITPADASKYASPIPGEEAIGRWDITLEIDGKKQPSWLEIVKSGGTSLVGNFVGVGGSARPVSHIQFDEGKKEYSFSIPAQWGGDQASATFTFDGEKLEGSMDMGEQKSIKWTGVRAPILNKQEKLIEWGSPKDLLKDGLDAWEDTKGWKVENGILSMSAEGTETDRNAGGNQNIRTKEAFEDFRMHVEFRYGEGANSGIYLRGRYEVQILDTYGFQPESHSLGGVYGFLAPTLNMAKKPGEWQSLDVQLIGRFVTITLNGVEIISNRPIPGITGGALDSFEGEPGPIMIQGDHYGLLEYRNMSITEGTTK